MRMLVLAVIALVIGAISTTAIGGAESIRDSFAFPFFDSCNNETVDVSGTFHAVVITKDNGDGTTNVKLNLNAKGNGIGAVSEVEYEFIDTIHQEITTGGPFVIGAFTDKVRLISHGANQNLIVDMTFSVDADGTITSVTVTNCRGAE